MQGRRPERFKPGKAGVSFFNRLISKGAKTWTLERLHFNTAGIEFSLIKAPRRLVFQIIQPILDKRFCLFSNRHLGLRLENIPDPTPEDRKTAASLFSALSATSFVKLLVRLKEDALFYSDTQGSALPSRLDRYYRLADHTQDWWKFYYPKEHFLEQEIRFGGKHVKIHHATLECHANNPWVPVASLRLFADERLPRPGADCLNIETDLGEKEVVGGKTLAVLSSILRDVATRYRPDSIRLMTTCLPELIGDDPRPIIKSIEKDFKIPVIWTAKTADSSQGFLGITRRMLNRIKFASKRDPRSIILAGIQSGGLRRETERLLDALGLRVVGALFPNLDFDSTRGIGSASAVIWVNPIGWQKIGDEHFIENGLAVVRYHPPFGIQGTRSWLHRICSVLGINRSLNSLTKSHHFELETLRKACRRKTVALIGDRADIESLMSRGQNLGFSIGMMLGEMSFSLKALVFDKGRPETVRREPSPVGSGKIEFLPFRTRRELNGLLQNGIDLTFTHFNHDPRLEAHGIPGFCEDAFEPGIPGFIRSAERLLHLCETKPFMGHRSHLTPWNP